MKNNWQTKKLGEVVLIYNGNSINEEVKKKNYLGLVKGIPYIATKDIGYDGIVNYNNGVKIPKGEFGFKKAGPGVVFVCAEGGSAGRKVAYIDKTVCFVNKLFAIKPSKYLDEKFLYFWFLSDSFKDQFFSNKTGLIGGVSMKKFKELVMSFPDVQEQKRIVKILDKVFENIDKVKENTQKNLQNSKELFETYLERVFANSGTGWDEKRLKDMGQTQTGTTPKTSNKDYYGNFIPFIKPADVDLAGDGVIRYSNEGLSENGLKVGRKVEQNSILMVCIGATIGKVGFTTQTVSCNQQINTLTPGNSYEAKVFYYILKTKSSFNKVIKASSQATLPIINKTKWENITIGFPKSLSQQKEIVKRLDELSGQTKKLEENYKQKLLLLDELKKSVLSKAFSGDL